MFESLDFLASAYERTLYRERLERAARFAKAAEECKARELARLPPAPQPTRIALDAIADEVAVDLAAPLGQCTGGGSVTSWHGQRRAPGGRLDPVHADEVLADDEAADLPRLTIRQVQDVVCDVFHIPRLIFLSQQRSRSLVRARQASFWFSRLLTGRSHAEIGRRHGDRDHTTTIYGVGRVETMTPTDDLEFTSRVKMCITKLRALGHEVPDVEGILLGAQQTKKRR